MPYGVAMVVVPTWDGAMLGHYGAATIVGSHPARPGPRSSKAACLDTAVSLEERIMRGKAQPNRRAWIIYVVTVLPVVALIGYVGYQALAAVGVVRLEPIMFYWDTETGGGSEVQGWTVLLLGYPISVGQSILLGVPILLVLASLWFLVLRALLRRGSRVRGSRTVNQQQTGPAVASDRPVHTQPDAKAEGD